MLLDTRSTPRASLSRSRLARGCNVGGRQIGGFWFEDPAKAGDPPANPDQKPDAKTDAKSDEQLGDAGKAALQKERDAREAAEKETKRLKKLVDDHEAAKKRAADEAAAANGQFEKLATDRQAEIEDLKRQIAERDAQALRAKIAAKHKLPEELASRLQGESESDLEADAKALAKLVKPPVAPDTEAGGSQGTQSGGLSNRQKDELGSQTKDLPTYRFVPRGAVPIPS